MTPGVALPGNAGMLRRMRMLDWLLTTDRHQRIRLTHSAIGTLLMAACVLVMHGLHVAGVGYSRWLSLWSVLALCGLAAFFVVIRRGWSRHLADPSLTFVQMLYAALMAAAAYPMAGAGRGAVMPILSVVLMFGMFGLTGRQMLAVAGWVLMVFGVSLGAASTLAPETFPPGIERAHYAMIAINVFGVVALGSRLRGMKRRLRQHKHELELALERIRVLATQDELTGLANRRRMQELMLREAQRAERSGAPLCLALIDLDHFKQINDRLGHAGGDEALRVFAEQGQRCIRLGDTLGRWGGEEFLLLLPETTLALSPTCLDRLRDALRSADLGAGTSPRGLRFSAGVAEYRPGEAIVRTLERADAALYAAKDAGRDRVEYAP